MHRSSVLLVAVLTCGLLAVATLAFAGDWPGWRGPLHTGVAPTDEKLVDDPAKAKRVWLSEDAIPGARVADGRKVVPASGLPHISGGFASPVYAEGRVYLYYYIPNGEGDDYAQGIAKKHEAEGGYGKEKWWIDTDDVIHCFDAKTGKTLWKRVFKRAGMNYNAFNKGGPCNLTPVVADGRVYAVGSAGKVYCVDAKSGEPIWDSDVGERYKLQEELRAVCKKQKVIPQYNRDMSSAPVVADGVLVTSDFLGYKVQSPLRHFNWSDRCGLVGFDIETGKRIWHLPKTLGNWNSPTVWEHEGKAYVLAGGAGEGLITCVDPKTGKPAWQFEAGMSQGTLVAEGDAMIGQADGSLACWTITPKGAKKRWSIGRGYDTTGSTIPIIHKGHVYASMKAGRIVCVDIKTGKVVGNVAINTGGFFVLMGDRLFADVELGHGGDQVYMLNADPTDFRAMGHVWNAPNATVYMNPLTPACADGRMYMRIEGGRLACYELRAAHAHKEPQNQEALESATPKQPAPKDEIPPATQQLPKDPFKQPGGDDDPLSGIE